MWPKDVSMTVLTSMAMRAAPAGLVIFTPGINVKVSFFIKK